MFADPAYYFNSALDWSDSGGNMRTDWVATIRSFARRDTRDGKMKVKHKTRAEIKQDNKSIKEIDPKLIVAMPDSMREKYLNIGKT